MEPGTNPVASIGSDATPATPPKRRRRRKPPTPDVTPANPLGGPNLAGPSLGGPGLDMASQPPAEAKTPEPAKQDASPKPVEVAKGDRPETKADTKKTDDWSTTRTSEPAALPKMDATEPKKDQPADNKTPPVASQDAFGGLKDAPPLKPDVKPIEPGVKVAGDKPADPPVQRRRRRKKPAEAEPGHARSDWGSHPDPNGRAAERRTGSRRQIGRAGDRPAGQDHAGDREDRGTSEAGRIGTAQERHRPGGTARQGRKSRGRADGSRSVA